MKGRPKTKPEAKGRAVKPVSGKKSSAAPKKVIGKTKKKVSKGKEPVEVSSDSDNDDDEDKDDVLLDDEESHALNEDEQFDTLVQVTARLFLFHEHTKTPVSKTQVLATLRETAGGGQVRGRLLQRVLHAVSGELMHLFGYEIVGLARIEAEREKPALQTFGQVREFALYNRLAHGIKKPDSPLKNLQNDPNLTLLFIVLTMIILEKGVIDEKTLLQNLEKLGFSVARAKHPVFGDWQKLLKTTWTKQRYLHRVDTKRTDKAHDTTIEYRWGARAIIELRRRNVLKFITQICGFDEPIEKDSDNIPNPSDVLVMIPDPNEENAGA